MRSTPAFAFVLSLAACHLSFAADLDGIEFFEIQIRPILVKHCYECHSTQADAIKGGLAVDSAAGLMTGGDSGPALVSEKEDESLLLSALRYESYEMPPAGKLPDDVIEDFERWLAMGAPDPRTDASSPAESLPRAIDLAQGRQFWAFQPVESRGIPELSSDDWSSNWIDKFILARQSEAGVTPNESADKPTLLRRLAYDLTGLPPARGEVERLLYDESATMESYVDSLLQSPQFGEQWGRHWLDVARYADSNGGDFNATFHEAWRYRNYIIEAFNQDRPFNELIVEQVAGDLIPAEDAAQRERQLVATGFLMLGTKMLSERDKEKLRMDVVDEQISAVGSAFLGMTLGCARCHDHKFDPIPTKDYYALAGIFRSTQTLDGEIQKYVSNWVRQPLPIEAEHEAALKQYTEQEKDFKARLKQAEARLKELESSSSRASELNRGVVIDDAQAEVVGQWKASSLSKEFVGKGYIHDDKQGKGEKRVTFRAMLPKTGEYEVRIAYPGNNGRDTAIPVTVIHADGTTEVSVNQEKVAPIERLLLPIGRYRFTEKLQAEVTISNQGTTGFVIADAVQFVPVEELQSDEGNAAQKQSLAELEGAKKTVESLQAELKVLTSNAPPPAPVALAVNDEETIDDYNICIRGEPRNLGPKVSRGFLSVAQFDEPPTIKTDESGRLQLAHWIADERNPLTARVYVNRVWSHLLGTGLVRSVDNFGQLGERPTHPELLDQLAVEFIAHGWSTKWLIREIVLSRVYQLSSNYNSERWSLDPENKLYWRANRKRLSAEAIRDSVLTSAGELDCAACQSPVTGLGTLVTQNTANDTGYEQEASPSRTIYQPVIRNELPSLMRVFDFADPDFVTGDRPETNVPSQALWMLNGPFIRTHAERTAKRVLNQQLSTNSEKIEQLYLLVMGRPATPEEFSLALEFVGESGESSESWSDLAHALFASSSFRMLD